MSEYPEWYEEQKQEPPATAGAPPEKVALQVKETWRILKYDGDAPEPGGPHKEPAEIWEGDDHGARRLYRAPNLWYEAPTFGDRLRRFVLRRKLAVQKTLRDLRRPQGIE